MPRSEQEVYPHAPLQEAVFEVRFPGRLRVESHRHELQERLDRDLPNLKVPVNEPEKPPFLKWYQLEASDGNEVVRTGINFLSYISKNYQGFASFKRRALEIILPALELFEVRSLTRSGLRYVNHIPLAKQDGAIPLNQFLKMGIRLPEIFPEVLEQLSLAFEVKMAPGLLRVHAAYIPSSDEQDELLLLDFDYYMPGPMESRRVEHSIDESHAHTKAVFESLITDDYRSFMRGEAK